MKKWMGVLLTAALAAILAVAFLAGDPAEETAGTRQLQSDDEQVVLRHAERYVAKLRTVELDSVDTALGDANLGEPIPVYRYENGKFVDSGVGKYPLFFSGRLVAFVTAYTNSHGNLATQFSFSLAEEVSDYLASHREIALIGDDYAVYATDGADIRKLKDCVTVSGLQTLFADRLSPSDAAQSPSLRDGIRTVAVGPKTPLY